MNTPSGILRAVMIAGQRAPTRASGQKRSGFVQLAEDLGVTRQAVRLWLKQGYVPLARALEIEALYGVPRATLVHPKYADMLSGQGFDSLDN